MKIVRRILAIALVLILGVRTACFVGVVAFGYGTNGELTYPEGSRAYAVERVAQGLPVYADFRQIPHVIVPYGPTYFYLAGYIERALGAGIPNCFKAGRIVSIAAYFSLAVFMCFWTRSIYGGWLAGVVVFMLFGSATALRGSCMATQVDSLAVLAIAVTIRLTRRSGTYWHWLLIWMMALLAWSTKQNAVALGPAIAAFLWQQTSWRAAALWLVAWIAGIGIVWFGLDQASDHWFTWNAVVALRRPTNWKNAMDVVRQGMPFFGVIFGIGSVALPSAMRRADTCLIAWWFVFAMAQAALATLGEGSGANYFFEPALPSCLLTVCALFPKGGVQSVESPQPAHDFGGNELSQSAHTHTGEALEPGLFGTWSGAVAILGLLMTCAAVGTEARHQYSQFRGEAVSYATSYEVERRTGWMPNLLPSVMSYEGEVFVQYGFLAMASRRPVHVLDILHYRQMADSGIIDVHILSEQFSHRKFGLVVLRSQIGEAYDPNDFMRWPREVWQAIHDNYSLAGEVDGQFVYMPKPAETAVNDPPVVRDGWSAVGR